MSAVWTGGAVPVEQQARQEDTMATYELENVCFATDMGCGSDVWRIFGSCPQRNMPNIMISTPISYDKEKEIIVTQRSIYATMSGSGTKTFSTLLAKRTQGIVA